MRNQIMSIAVLLFVVGCSKEEGINTNENGSITFKGKLVSGQSDRRAEFQIAEDSGNAAEFIRYVMTDSKDSLFTSEVSLAAEGANIVSGSAVSLPSGKYTIEDIALLSADGTIVQRMPNKLATRFNRIGLSSTSTPFEIYVSDGEETILNGELVDYAMPKTGFNGDVGKTFVIQKLQTMYFEVDEKNAVCLDSLLIKIDGKTSDIISIGGPGLYNTPVPKEFFTMEIIAFSGKKRLQHQTIKNSKIPTRVFNPKNIIKFKGLCGEVEPEPAELFDYRDGGIVVWVDPSDSSHGIVCAIQDQGPKASWGCEGVEVMAPDQDPNSLNHDGTSVAIGTGESNTFNILYTCPEPAIAARLSDDYSVSIDGVVYDDWFLPSRDLLNQMYLNRAAIDAIALANGGAAFSDEGYWSSSHDTLSFLHIAWFQNFGDGNSNGALKSLEFNVRSVRAF